MKNLIAFLINYWFWFTIGMSLFWGIRSSVLFADRKIYLQNTIWWKIYQFIFNFVGSLAGWFCFYALLTRTQNNLPGFRNFTWGDIVLFIISLLGLTGHLPQVTYGFVEAFVELTKKVIEKASIKTR